MPSSYHSRTSSAPILPMASTHTEKYPSNGTGNTVEPLQDKHLWLVSGPAGSGKTSTAKFLSDSLKLPYVEGDSYHPPANVAKMSQGIPLTDEDRWDWLATLREESVKQLRQGHDGVVVTCSALKRKYRDVMRVAPYYFPGLKIHFVFLHAPEEVLLERVGHRQGHYMGANMVHSQIAIIEPAAEWETDVIMVDVSPTEAVVQATVLKEVKKAMRGKSSSSNSSSRDTERWRKRVRSLSLISFGAFAFWQTKDIALEVWQAIMTSRMNGLHTIRA